MHPIAVGRAGFRGNDPGHIPTIAGGVTPGEELQILEQVRVDHRRSRAR